MSALIQLTPDVRRFLFEARRLPAILDADQAAAMLGRHRHDITTLIQAKLLVPLGKPTKSAPKVFSTKRILELCEDEDWLNTAQLVLSKNWRDKNERKNGPSQSAD